MWRFRRAQAMRFCLCTRVDAWLDSGAVGAAAGTGARAEGGYAAVAACGGSGVG